MFHVDNESGVSTMPPLSPESSSTPKFFTESPPTYPGADWFNIVQSELLNVLQDAGIEPNKVSLTQLSRSISALAKKSGHIFNRVEKLKSSTLTFDDFGSRFWVDYDSPSAVTLPDISSIGSGGQTITIWNVKDANITVNVGHSTNIISIPMSTVKSFTLRPTESATFIVEQDGVWHATGDGVLKNSLMFGANLAANGWKREPSGLLTQWGTGAPVGGRCMISFPIAFASRPFNVVFGHRDAYYPSYAQSVVVEDASLNNLGFTCRCMNAITPVVDSPSAFFWRAEGV